MQRIVATSALTVLVLATAGCAHHHSSPPASAPVAYNQGPAQRAVHGEVYRIDRVRGDNRTSGGGAVLGGVVGAVAGHQVGSGSGKDAATVVGAIGGALIGNQIERQQQRADDFYRVTIRTRRGDLRSFDYQQLNELQVGDRVRIENGQVYRL
jgi:outer membrane lipoprotein SlyB